MKIMAKKTPGERDKKSTYQPPPEELRRRADEIARAAGYPDAEEAFRLLDEGKLKGTLIESELRMVRFLHKGPDASKFTGSWSDLRTLVVLGPLKLLLLLGILVVAVLSALVGYLSR